MINSETQNSPKLSVIVIAYNNELYIEEALESLDQQTFSEMEVVVVNDLSTDNTGQLIEDFIKDKPNFKVVHHKENSGGCSKPRNTGIANSTGEYIMFLDGDDWYTIDACGKMVAAIEKTDSDFVAGQAIRTNNYNIWYHGLIYSKERININIREFKPLLFDSLSVNKIYKRSFLDKHKLRFPEGIHYEDVVFTGKAYFLADSVSVIPEPIYYWRVVEDADVKSISNRRYEFENFRNRITSHRYYDEFLKDIGAVNYQEHKNNRFLKHDLKLYTNDYLLFDEEYRLKFHELIYEYLHEVMDEYAFIRFPEKERIMNYLLYIGDRDAFEDYVAYINGLPTKSNRIYNIGNEYFFKTSKTEGVNKKFLKIGEPEISYTINHISLESNTFSFRSKVEVPSISINEITYFWRLRNRQTGEVIHSQKVDKDHFSFNLKEVSPGNYYLSLFLTHQGNLFKKLIKNSQIDYLPNIKTNDSSISKSIFINHKNSFAIKVTSHSKIQKIKWKLRNNEVTEKFNETFNQNLKKLVNKLPLRSKWVFFESHMGKQYSDNPKYIYEEMFKTGKKLKYIWGFQNPENIEIPGPAKKVKKDSLKYYYYLNRSKYWIDNQGLANLAKKKKQQIYLQTWHGTPLKMMGYDQKKQLTKKEVSRLKRHTNSWDYFITTNQYSTNIFRRAFRYTGNIIETGYPRNDVLINNPKETGTKVRNYFDLRESQKVVLYSPTFREWDRNSFQNVLRDVNFLSENVSENTVVILRLHYLLSDKLDQFNLPENIINASSYEDIQELYLISNILITDYSSAMFDYALLKRPIIFYCYDLEEYKYKRGLYFELAKKAPGPVCRAIEEVVDYIEYPDKFMEFEQDYNDFLNEFGSVEEGHATSRVIKKVFE
ncbi:bifunctional glycosyltransferase/CDP-glycerol:glycerophosphate glycerophosphotransferase [Virgibacillus sp. W0181]|uniref:bifunctional glycosyltransferase/CDP-glycerol:glycerophosphate glycerophosphotransferase n=1 Tax=Virgibacillus sp. W0181 TaxID=3391581 RepID=UPI003F4515C8